MASLGWEEKERFLRAVEEDREFRYALMGLLGYKEILEQLTEIRRSQQKLEERQQRLEERQQKLEERFARLEERLARLEERQQRLEERMIKLEERMVSLEKLVVTVANRFGVIVDMSFREAIRGIVVELFGGEASRWSVYDEEGLVFGYPSIVEADLIVKDGVHLLVEVKSRADPEDVYKVWRLGVLYERKTGVKPRLALVAGFASRKAYEAASRLGVKVYSYLGEGA